MSTQTEYQTSTPPPWPFRKIERMKVPKRLMIQHPEPQAKVVGCANSVTMQMVIPVVAGGSGLRYFKATEPVTIQPGDLIAITDVGGKYGIQFTVDRVT